MRERHGRCCEWEKVIAFEPIDCPEPEEVVVAGRTECITTCRISPNGTQVCETVCLDRYALSDDDCDEDDPICIPKDWPVV